MTEEVRGQDAKFGAAVLRACLAFAE